MILWTIRPFCRTVADRTGNSDILEGVNRPELGMDGPHGCGQFRITQIERVAV